MTRRNVTLGLGGVLFALVVVPFVARASLGEGANPRSISYQGRLEKDGMPLTGTVELQFTTYPSSTAAACGAPLTLPNVPVNAGLFAVEVGPITESCFSNTGDG